MAFLKSFCLETQGVIQQMNSLTSKIMQTEEQITGRGISQTLLFLGTSLESTSRHQAKKSRSTRCGLSLNLKLPQREVSQNRGFLIKEVKLLMTLQSDSLFHGIVVLILIFIVFYQMAKIAIGVKRTQKHGAILMLTKWQVTLDHNARISF
jgi:hypothetical protein